MKQKKVTSRYAEYEHLKAKLRKAYETKSKATFDKEFAKSKVPQRALNYWIKQENWILNEPKKDLKLKKVLDSESDGLFALKDQYGITDTEMSVCMEYIKTPNWTRAYKRVFGAEADTEDIFKFRHDPKIKDFVKEVQKRFIENVIVDADRLLDELNAIAFGDIGDIMNFSGDEVKIKPGSSLDTRMIKKISQNREGVTVELHSKLDAIHTLLKYAGVPNPAKSNEGKTLLRTVEQAQNDERLKLAWEKFEFEKSLEQGGGFEAPDDGFLEALNKASKTAFNDEDGGYGDSDGEDEDDDE